MIGEAGQTQRDVANMAKEVVTADLTDDQINRAVAASIEEQFQDDAEPEPKAQAEEPEESDETTESEATEETQEAKEEAETEDEAATEEATEENASKEEAKVDREKLQKVNRELGNMRRQNELLTKQVAEMVEGQKKLLESLASQKPPETKAEAKNIQTATNLLELLTNLADDDVLDGAKAKQLARKIEEAIGSIRAADDSEDVRKQLKEVQEKLKAYENVQVRNEAIQQNEQEFNEVYPALEGQYARLNTRALEAARSQLGDKASADAVVGAATVILNGIARKLSKTTSATPKVEATDKTKAMKPASSTKGTATVKTSAVSKPNKNLSQDEIFRAMARQLQEEVAG